MSQSRTSKTRPKNSTQSRSTTSCKSRRNSQVSPQGCSKKASYQTFFVFSDSLLVGYQPASRLLPFASCPLPSAMTGGPHCRRPPLMQPTVSASTAASGPGFESSQSLVLYLLLALDLITIDCPENSSCIYSPLVLLIGLASNWRGIYFSCLSVCLR